MIYSDRIQEGSEIEYHLHVFLLQVVKNGAINLAHSRASRGSSGHAHRLAERFETIPLGLGLL